MKYKFIALFQLNIVGIMVKIGKINYNSMKLFISLVLFASLAFGCASSKKEDRWTMLQYDFTAGPISPEYYYEYNITIETNGKGTFIYKAGSETYNYSFTVTNSQLLKLTEAIDKSKILDENIKEGEKLIGGPTKKLKVLYVNPDPNFDQPPKVYETPYFIAKEYSENVNKLYELIVNTVPQDLFKDAQKKAEDLRNKN
jgi:hypothetical protein